MKTSQMAPSIAIAIRAPFAPHWGRNNAEGFLISGVGIIISPHCIESSLTWDMMYGEIDRSFVVERMNRHFAA